MALLIEGRYHCKMVHSENLRVTTRRIHEMMIQAADGRVFWLRDAELPDEIMITSGIAHKGSCLAQILLSPNNAKAVPLIFQSGGWPCSRDTVHFVVGMMSGLSAALWIALRVYYQTA